MMNKKEARFGRRKKYVFICIDLCLDFSLFQCCVAYLSLSIERVALCSLICIQLFECNFFPVDLVFLSMYTYNLYTYVLISLSLSVCANATFLYE